MTHVWHPGVEQFGHLPGHRPSEPRPASADITSIPTDAPAPLSNERRLPRDKSCFASASSLNHLPDASPIESSHKDLRKYHHGSFRKNSRAETQTGARY